MVVNVNPYERTQQEAIGTEKARRPRTVRAFVFAIVTFCPVYLLFRLFAEDHISIYRSLSSTFDFWASILTWPLFGLFLASVTHVSRNQYGLTTNSQIVMAVLLGVLLWNTSIVDKAIGFRIMGREGLEFASVSGNNYAHLISLACLWLGFPLLVAISLLRFRTTTL